MSIFRLPDLGEGLHEAEIVRWHVAPGDRVKAGQTLVSIETDKALVDIPSPRDGIVVGIHGTPGEHIDVGAPLVDYEEEGRPDNGGLVGRLPIEDAAPERERGADRTGQSARVKAAPAVRARARVLGIDISDVPASGPEGQVTAADLDRAAGQAAVPHAGATPSEVLRGPRRAMARAIARAHAEVATATVTDDAVVPDWSDETDVTLLLVAAVAHAARAVPALNCWFDTHTLSRTVHDDVHVGVAVDTADGLFVPVLRHAGTRSRSDLRHELDRLKHAVASRTISRDDFRDPTITISNFGLLGGRYAAMSLLPPQVAILGAGQVAERVVARNGVPTVCRTQPLSLTFDHRAVTGGEAARFLSTVKRQLEEPGQ